MKTKKLTHAATALLLAGSSVLTLNSCQDQKNLYDAGGPGDKQQTDYFDFNTSSTVAFDLNYGSYGANRLLSIYVSNPFEGVAEGETQPQGDVAYMIFADENGRFSGNVTLPSYTDSVWVYASGFGVPALTAAQVKNGKVALDLTKSTKATKSGLATRLPDDVYAQLEDADLRLYEIVAVGDIYGKPDDKNGLMSEGTVSATEVQRLQYALWNKQASKNAAGQMINQKYALGANQVNTEISTTYTDSDGNIQTVDNAELWITFVNENGWNENTLGYYYYKADEVPTSASEVDKFIVIPNASVTGSAPFGTHNNNWEFDADKAPIKMNDRFQLLFKKEDGTFTTKFPAGYVIGYFIISDGFGRNWDSQTVLYNTTHEFMYSNEEWNVGGKKSFMAGILNDEGTIVYGVEDGLDNSYEDVLFTVDGNPNYVLKDHNLPKLDMEAGELMATEYTYHTYAFEDKWPERDGGDYDLNDVIIQHRRAVTFGSFSNDIRTIEDVFTPVQKSDAATYNDAFAVQFKDFDLAQGSMTGRILGSGMIDETETGSVIITEDTKASRGYPLTVTRTFTGWFEKEWLDQEDLNPFIISKYVKGADNRLEVHLPKHEATSKADASKSLTGDDAWYIHKDGQFPFALSLPIQNYTPAPECQRIDLFYLDYAKWAESKGESNADWYLYPGTSKE